MTLSRTEVTEHEKPYFLIASAIRSQQSMERRERDYFLFLDQPDNVWKLSVEAHEHFAWISVSETWGPNVWHG